MRCSAGGESTVALRTLRGPQSGDEKWQSREYLLSEAHQKSSHLSSCFETITPLLAEPARWSLLDDQASYSNADGDG